MVYIASHTAADLLYRFFHHLDYSTFFVAHVRSPLQPSQVLPWRKPLQLSRRSKGKNCTRRNYYYFLYFQPHILCLGTIGPKTVEEADRFDSKIPTICSTNWQFNQSF